MMMQTLMMVYETSTDYLERERGRAHAHSGGEAEGGDREKQTPH